MSYIEKVSELVDKTALSGRELLSELRINYDDRSKVVDLWAECVNSDLTIAQRNTQYLRLNKHNGQEYLSPSVPRRFADFSAISKHPDLAAQRLEQLSAQHVRISEEKKDTLNEILDDFRGRLHQVCPNFDDANYCALIAGDVTYNMASDAPRETAYGKVVDGSDIDLIIIVKDGVDIKPIEEILYREKVKLTNPPYGEELDFKVKTVSQAITNTHCKKHTDLIALKILVESIFLRGNGKLIYDILEEATANGGTGTLAQAHAKAISNRKLYEQILLDERS